MKLASKKFSLQHSEMGLLALLKKYAGFVVCLASLALGQSAHATTGPVVSWPLDDMTGTTAFDTSGFANHGALQNGPVWTTGPVNGALRFDGVNDSLSKSSIQGLATGNTPHTISGWIKVNALPSSRAWIVLLGNAAGGSHHWLINSSGGTQFGVYGGAQVGPSLPVGQWKHVAITFDGTTMTGYVDGVTIGSQAATFNIQGIPLTVGNPPNSENFFNGEVDDLRVYDRALSAAEVTALVTNQPPAVSITSPASGSTFYIPGSVSLSANAVDSDGAIARVDYYNGQTLIGSSSTPPYSVTWVPGLLGTYNLKALAVDNLGTSQFSSPVTVTVAKSPTAPALVWPLDEMSGTVAGDTSGLGNNGTLTNGPVWTSGYGSGAVSFDGVNDYISHTTVQGMPPGNVPHTITGWVKVNALPASRAWILLLGNPGTGSHHWLVGSNGSTQLGAWAGPGVHPVLPIGQWKHVAITFDGSTVTGYVNGSVIGTNTGSFNLQGMPLKVAQAQNGEEYFNGVVDDVRIYDRVLSQEEIAAIIAINNQPPTVQLTSPTSSDSFIAPAAITLTANATDSDGIAKVEYYNGQTLIGTVTAPPYTGTWNSVYAGTYNLTAKAYDTYGTSTISSGVQITVGENPPSVQITSPANNAKYQTPVSLLFQASATDQDGTIAFVAYYDGTTYIGTATEPPYAVSWENASAGVHSLTAVATDNAGNTGTSPPIQVTIDATGDGTKVYYVYPDHLNTPRAITDVANKIIWRWDSDPFGTTLANEDPDGDGTRFTYNLRFPGQYYDKETGLHYNYFRDYDPGTGRYVQSDPIGLEGGLNTYAYALGNPLKYYDSNGLDVRFICRRLDGAPGDLGYKHCFVYVKCLEENWAVTLSLFAYDFANVGRKELNVRGTPGFGSRDNPDSPNNTDDIEIFPKEQKCGTCEFEKRVLNEYYAFPSGDLPYFLLGPNSNTFAQTIINRSGGSWGGQGISNAPGMRR